MAKTKDFETVLTELEEVVKELDGDVKLEKALDLFERGMKLSKECHVFLKGAEEKVEILKRNMDGTISSEPFGDDDDDDDGAPEEEDDDDDDDDDIAESDGRSKPALKSKTKTQSKTKAESNQLSLEL